MISAAALYVTHAGSSHRSSGGHTCSWWRCNRQTRTLCFPNLNGRIVTPLMGWQFRTANFAERFRGRSVRMCPCYGVANNPSCEQSSPVTACRVHESFPGKGRVGDGRPSGFRNWCICCEASFRSGRQQAPVVVGLEAGCDTPVRPAGLHESAYRPSGLVAIPPAFQGFVDPSITGGFVRNSCEEDTSRQLASSFTALCGMSDTPPVAPGCSSPECDTTRTVAHPDGFRGGCLPWRRGVRVSCSSPESPAVEEGRRFIFEVDPPVRASRSSALIFLYSASWAAVISSLSMPEWVFLHLFTQHPHGLRDQSCRSLPPRLAVQGVLNDHPTRPAV